MSEFKLTTVEEFEAATNRLLETCLLYTSIYFRQNRTEDPEAV